MIDLDIGALASPPWFIPDTTTLLDQLTEFRRRHPAIHFRIKEAFPDALREAVHSGEIDLAVVSGDGNDAWGQDSLILIGPPKPAGKFAFGPLMKSFASLRKK